MYVRSLFLAKDQRIDLPKNYYIWYFNVHENKLTTKMHRRRQQQQQQHKTRRQLNREQIALFLPTYSSSKSNSISPDRARLMVLSFYQRREQTHSPISTSANYTDRIGEEKTKAFTLTYLLHQKTPTSAVHLSKKRSRSRSWTSQLTKPKPWKEEQPKKLELEPKKGKKKGGVGLPKASFQLCMLISIVGKRKKGKKMLKQSSRMWNVNLWQPSTPCYVVNGEAKGLFNVQYVIAFPVNSSPRTGSWPTVVVFAVV